MKTQDQKIRQIKRYKKTSIAFPIIGGVLLAGGAAAGITIGLMKLPKVTAEGGTVEMNPNSAKGTVTFKFKDNVQGNEVTAKLGKTNSNAQDDETTVVFDDEKQGGTSSLVTLPLQGDEAKLDIMLVNPPKEAGEYSYTYSVTFEYKNSDGKTVSHKIDNLRVNYTVNDEWLYITEPEASQYEKDVLLDEAGSTTVTIGRYSYRGEISNENDLDVNLINYNPGTMERDIEVVPSIVFPENPDPEDKTFDVQIKITHGHGKELLDSYTITGNLQFTFKSAVVLEQSHNLNIKITEAVTITETEEGRVETIQLVSGQTHYETTFGGGPQSTYAGLATTGMYDLRTHKQGAELQIKGNEFELPEGMTVKLEVNELESWQESTPKNFKIKATINFENPDLLTVDREISSALKYTYIDSKGNRTEIEGKRSFIIKFVAVQGIYAPDMSVQPDHIKLTHNLDYTASETDQIRFTNFGFSGFDSLANIEVHGTDDFAEYEYAKLLSFAIDQDSVDVGQRKFDIVATFKNIPAIETGRELVGNFEFYDKATGIPVAYENPDDFSVKIEWKDEIKKSEEQVEYQEDVRLTDDNIVTVTYENALTYTGFEDVAQQNNVVIKMDEIQGLKLLEDSSKVRFSTERIKQEDVRSAASLVLNFEITDPALVVKNSPITLSNLRVEYLVKPSEATQQSYPLSNFKVRFFEKYNIDDEYVQKQYQQQLVWEPTIGITAETYIKLENFKYSGFDLNSVEKQQAFLKNIDVLYDNTSFRVEQYEIDVDTEAKTFDLTLHVYTIAAMYDDAELYVNLGFKTPDTEDYFRSNGYVFKLTAANSISDDSADHYATGRVNSLGQASVTLNNFKYTGYPQGVDKDLIPYFTITGGASVECAYDKIDVANKTFSINVPLSGLSITTPTDIYGVVSMHDTQGQVKWASYYTTTININQIGKVTDYDVAQGQSTVVRKVETALVEDSETGNTSATFTYSGFRYEGFEQKEDRDLLKVEGSFKSTQTSLPTGTLTGEINWHVENKTFDVTFTAPLKTRVLVDELKSEGIRFVIGDAEIYKTGYSDDGQFARYSVDVHSDATVAEIDQKEWNGQFAVGATDLTVTIGDGTHKFKPSGFRDVAFNRVSVRATEGSWGSDAVSAKVTPDSYDAEGFTIDVTITNPTIKTYSGTFDILIDGEKLMTTDRYLINATVEKGINVSDVKFSTTLPLPYHEGGQQAVVTFEDIKTVGLSDADKTNINIDTSTLAFDNLNHGAISTVYQFQSTSPTTFNLVVTFGGLQITDLTKAAAIKGSIGISIPNVVEPVSINLGTNGIVVTMDDKPTIAAPAELERTKEVDIITREDDYAYVTFEGFSTEGFTTEQKQAGLILAGATGDLADAIESSDIIWTSQTQFKLELKLIVAKFTLGTASTGGFAFNLAGAEEFAEPIVPTDNTFSITIKDPIISPEIKDFQAAQKQDLAITYKDEKTLVYKITGFQFVGIENTGQFTASIGQNQKWYRYVDGVDDIDITEDVQLSAVATWVDRYSGWIDVSVSIDIEGWDYVETGTELDGEFTITGPAGQTVTPLVTSNWSFITPENPVPPRNITFPKEAVHTGKLQKIADNKYGIKITGYAWSGLTYEEAQGRFQVVADWYLNGSESKLASGYSYEIDYHKTESKYTGTFDITFVFDVPVVNDGDTLVGKNLIIKYMGGTPVQIGDVDPFNYQFSIDAVPSITGESVETTYEFNHEYGGWVVTMKGFKTNHINIDTVTNLHVDTTIADRGSRVYDIDWSKGASYETDHKIDVTFTLYGDLELDHELFGLIIFTYNFGGQKYNFVIDHGSTSWKTIESLESPDATGVGAIEASNWTHDEEAHTYSRDVTISGFDYGDYVDDEGNIDPHLMCEINPLVNEGQDVPVDIFSIVGQPRFDADSGNMVVRLSVSESNFTKTLAGTISFQFYYIIDNEHITARYELGETAEKTISYVFPTI